MANMALIMSLSFQICWFGLKKSSSLEYLRVEMLSIHMMTCQSLGRVKEHNLKRSCSKYSMLRTASSMAWKELRLLRSRVFYSWS